MHLSPEEIIERIRSVQIVKAYAKLDVERGFSSRYSSEEYWKNLEEAKVSNHKYFESLIIHVDVKFENRWAKINTTMKDRRIKERILKCICVDYQRTQIGDVRTELHKFIIEIVEAGKKYAQDNRLKIIKQCENELILSVHQKRYSRITYEDAVVFIRQSLEKHPEIDLSEIENIWKEVQIKTAMEQ